MQHFKIGQKVIWVGKAPSGEGEVMQYKTYLHSLYILWEDGQETALSDKDAMKFVKPKVKI